MSWSIQVIGKPENIVAELEAESGRLSGQSKIEFDDAKPYIAGLVQQTFSMPGSGYTVPLIKLHASGSGTAKIAGPAAPPEQLQRSCTVSIEPMWTKLV